MVVSIIEQNQLWTSIGIVFILTLFYFFYWINKKKLRRLEGQFNHVMEMNKSINLEKGLEENLERFLEKVADLIEAPTYSFYVLGEKNKSYILKAVRYLSKDFGKVSPSYSGLLSFQATTYMPSLSLPISKRVYKIKALVDGDIPLIFIPVGEKGMILIGPLERIDKETSGTLEELCQHFSYLLDGLMVAEDIRSHARVVIASGKALQKISSISMNWTILMEKTIKLCVQSIDASGGFIIQRVNDAYQIILQVGLNKLILQELNEDTETLKKIYSYLEVKDGFCSINRKSEEYYSFPPYIAAAGMEAITMMKLGKIDDSVLFIWFEEEEKDRGYGNRRTLDMMLEHVRRLVGYQEGIMEFSYAHLDILKILARLLDHLSPYTIGYSEMMSRYCVIIARQLKLGEDEIKDIALAAYLSNIGVLGLSSTLFEREGKYTEEEYEFMKLHSEVGASIVNVATGNDRIASYIMHHHERIDGNGYPFGLKDEEIPIGAKIIAVVQTFLAKINGRNYRVPLSFNNSIELLQSCAGTQLDEQIVNVFIQWYSNKRKASKKGKPMGNCWEILCVPTSICRECPVYLKENIHCWEVENNLCQAHGKSCETCLVKTEYVTRAI